MQPTHRVLIKVRRFLGRVWRWNLRQAAAIREMALLARKTPSPIEGPVFIIGSPRSGTTLLYQALVQRFQVGFLTNLHDRCCRAPILLSRLFARRIEENRHLNYESSYGRIEGRLSPREEGARHTSHDSHTNDVPTEEGKRGN